MTSTSEIANTIPNVVSSGAHRTVPAPAPLTRYVDTSLLGQGGMGEVYACEDRQIGRVVARKTLRARLADTTAVQRFVDEACLQGQLEHPAIVPVYDIGESERGVPYFTMKCLHGRTLAAELEARRQREPGAWSVRRLLSALSTVALAIDYAHGRGVVHGDLKPNNVMLGRFGEVHVLDWGCATESRDASTERHATAIDVRSLATLRHEETDPNAIIGTPGYIAPEQARGIRGMAGSDVYALGAILFEILTGERFHRGTTAVALLVSLIDDGAKRPTARVPSLEIPPALDALVERALDRDPALRPSAREVAAEIEAVLDAEASEIGVRRRVAERVSLAREHAKRALDDGDTRAREQALRHAGHALALDPTNPDARDVLGRLLVQPPDELPAEAHEELRASEGQLVRGAVDAMSKRSLVWLAAAPFVVAMGVRSATGTALTIVLLALALAVLFRARQHPDLSSRARLGLLALTLAPLTMFAGLFGPFVLVPVFVTTTATMLSGGMQFAQRRVASALALLALLAPYALEMIGVLPPSMTITADAIVLHPRLVAYSPELTGLLLVVGHAIALPVCVMLTGRLWDAMDHARRKLALRTWQLERALPAAR